MKGGLSISLDTDRKTDPSNGRSVGDRVWHSVAVAIERGLPELAESHPDYDPLKRLCAAIRERVPAGPHGLLPDQPL